jgi:hypothetical protein
MVSGQIGQVAHKVEIPRDGVRALEPDFGT